MDRFARTVLGYHGCDPAFAEKLLNAEVPIDDWKPSTNDYNWLGHGIYFWEYAPERALTWGNRPSAVKGGVIGAIIQLGNCLDLTDIRDTQLLADSFESMREEYEREGIVLPTNGNGRNLLDCLVINRLAKNAADRGIPFQTVRCPFLEGGEVFPGSTIRGQSHVQLVVRNSANILGFFSSQLASRKGNPMTEETRRILRAAILEERKLPHEVRWQKMIDAGFIDAKGNVLLKARMPRDPALGPDPEDEAEQQTRPEA